MCGILGYSGPGEAKKVLHEGMRRLEYRGYDSAGIAVGDGVAIRVTKDAGRVDWLDTAPLGSGRYGIAHTRWATHGPPTAANAHPHLSCDGRFAVAHNGILEEFEPLREALRARGHRFLSETDSEVVAHLLEEAYRGDLAAAFAAVVSRLKGSWALVATCAMEPGVVVGTRKDSPLVVGIGEGEAFLASDVVAFRAHTDIAVYLDDGDLAVLRDGKADVRPASGRPVARVRIPWTMEDATLAGFPHFMLKEIHDQPRALHDALVGRTQPGKLAVEGALPLERLAAADELVLTACGSSYHAALGAVPFFESYARMPTRVVVASEFPEAGPVLAGRGVVVAITQSGETADTLYALRAAARAGLPTLAVANVVGSTATRVADGWLPIRAGPEVSVAATKSFSSQLLVLQTLALQLGAARSARPASQIQSGLDAIRDVPALVRRVLEAPEPFLALGRRIARTEAAAFVLGRGQSHAVALETALKIKEVSYVHAEGIAAGELKHGPLALVEAGVPALAFAADGPLLQPTLSAMREVAARAGEVVGVTDAPSRVVEAGFEALALPEAPPALFPYGAVVAGQLVAYGAAVARGADVDKPRNLAKSVTVG